MITSRPQNSTITSVVLFLVITILVVSFNFAAIVRDRIAAWYNYLIVILLIPIGLLVFYKIFLRYKILQFGNNQIQIDYPVMMQSKKYTIEQIERWIENKVKTGQSSEYKELEILFSDRKKITIGHKEHTEYSRIVQYLAQKAPKKKAT